MEIVPITEGEAHCADVMPIPVECESVRETLKILSDSETLADLRRSWEDFVAGDVFDVDQVRVELETRSPGGV